MSYDKYLSIPYEQYGCWKFVKMAWQDITGECLIDFTPSCPDGRSCIDAAQKACLLYNRLDTPTDLCIALFESKSNIPHVGIYSRGKILHMSETGVHCMPTHRILKGFDKVRYYLPCKK